MAEAVVAIVAEGIKLGHFIMQQAKFLSEVSDQVELAQVELLLMQGYLKDADARQAEDEVVRIWVRIIRDSAYDLEDVIQSFALKVTLKKKGSIKLVMARLGCFFKQGVDLYNVGSEIENITTKLSKIRLSLQSYNIREIRGSGAATSSFERQQERRLTYPHVVEPNVVGLEDDVKKLSMELRKEEKCLQVVSIWGMGGSGKTTLAKQVYCDDQVKRHFDCFAWVCISQQCHGRTVLEEILVKLISATKDQRKEIAKMKKDEIAEKLCITLREKKCLVVLDDIWTLDAWNSLKVGFPINGESESRILLTTRKRGVVSHATEENGFLHQPRPLNESESWELFEKITNIRRDSADSEIYTKKKELGEKMLQHCVGLPLAVKVLGGILASKDTIDEWEKVHMNANVYIRRGTTLEEEYKGQGYEGASWVLALSYDDLPYLLKLCFLYLGHFPEDFEIPVKRLTHLWIAEGFISLTSQRHGLVELMEDVSYNCFCELVERCMVQVVKYGLTKRIKTCRLHDLMRDLCLLKAEEENFLHIANLSAAVTKATPIIGKVRRLAIYLDQGVNKLVHMTRDGHVRSLLYFTPPNSFSYWNKQLMRSRFKDFKLLRVLKFEGMGGNIWLPSEIGSLVHLRFLSLRNSYGIKGLPSSVGNLVCMQTLDLRCDTYKRVVIPNVIWKLEQLRHLYLPPRYSVKGIFKVVLRFGALGNLQTLVNVKSSNWDLKDLGGLSNLRKLDMEVADGTPLEEVEEVLKSTSITFKSLQSLSVKSINEEVLRRMVLSCPHIYKLKLRGPIKELPEDLLRYPNLTKIKLDGTRLKEEQIEILEKLPHLRMLYLCENHSIHSLVCSQGGFPHLEFLSLDNLYELKEWRVEKGAMPSLCRLHIECCRKLTEVPDGLQYVTTLKELTIKRMPRTFCSRLGEGGEDFYKIKHVPSLIISHPLDGEYAGYYTRAFQKSNSQFAFGP